MEIDENFEEEEKEVIVEVFVEIDEEIIDDIKKEFNIEINEEEDGEDISSEVPPLELESPKIEIERRIMKLQPLAHPSYEGKYITPKQIGELYKTLFRSDYTYSEFKAFYNAIAKTEPYHKYEEHHPITVRSVTQMDKKIVSDATTEALAILGLKKEEIEKIYIPHRGPHAIEIHYWALAVLREAQQMKNIIKQKKLDFITTTITTTYQKYPFVLRTDFWERLRLELGHPTWRNDKEKAILKEQTFL